MEVTKLADALPYDAPMHHGMAALRLHGGGQTNTERMMVGLSHFLPGGGADESSSEAERVYVVLEGQITVITNDDTVLLGPLDSCLIPPGETRAVLNATNRPASMLVIVVP
ncbi:MAG: quercetin dioxygenase-like cupin family protein [Rhodothermales bacterium]|jgi:quercetin dioxygenase-like cupin family protein